MIKSQAKGPVLITGVFRSGTTLISQVLNNHPDLCIIYDSVNFMRFSYDRYNPINDLKNAKNLISEIHIRIKDRWNLTFDKESVIKTISSRKITYGLVYDIIMSELLLSDSQATIWGEKTTLVWTKIPAFFKMFPHGRVVHIIRDPRAVLASWKKMTHAPGYDYLDSIFNCIDSMQKARLYANKYSDRNYASIKYEQLVKNPDLTSKKICEQLGFEYHINITKSDEFKEKSGNEKWKGNSMFEDELESITTTLVDKWKEKLYSWEIGLVQNLMSELLQTYNYEILKNNKFEVNEAIEKIISSNLVNNSSLKFLLTKKGVEQFPSNPLNPKNWEQS